MTLLLLADEPTLIAIDPTIARGRTGESQIVSLASAIGRWFALDVVNEPARRALLRRLARAHPPEVAPCAVTSAPFARYAAAVLDGLATAAEQRALGALARAYRRLLTEANLHDVASACAHLGHDAIAARAAREAATASPPSLAARPRYSAGVLGTLRTALAWAGTRDDAAARRLIVSAYSPVPEIDAHALLVVAERRGTLLEAIAQQRVVLSEVGRPAAIAFAGALERIALAYRAPNATASETIAAIVTDLGLERGAGPGELATLVAVRTVADAFDRAVALTAPEWLAAELSDVLYAELGSGELASLPLEALAPVLVDDEAPRGVPSRRSHYSASSLNTFAECRRKWYFRYVCAAVEDRGSSASFYGTAFHWALQGFHERYPSLEGVATAALQQHLEGHVNAAFERYRDGFGSTIEYELQRRRAQRTARKYVEWLVARAQRAPFVVIGCELAAEVDLEGYAFVGYIDRLDRDLASGGVTVVDYKTGTIAESAAEYRDDVRKFTEFQLPFYYWARTAAGDRVTKLALVPLKDALLDVAPIELEVVFGPGENGRRRNDATTGTISVRDLELARAKMVELCATIESGSIAAFEATTDVQACRYCAYRASCRERPAAPEERFAR